MHRRDENQDMTDIAEEVEKTRDGKTDMQPTGSDKRTDTDMQPTSDAETTTP